ncbi:DUF1501 domain-containing protein [Lignipirellula cremea]|uniref:DUF1501 domain-containing protein n=1 Tax=Lignipirellula cremea TaxID=2528010 RepID=A0A518DWU8_9BACT|nr:DUF1501 domain-containing protein [Lignipirellula cremea]QDU96311.1 hypothetical protein Pla8534_41310 [Lignipirellula cremea]
MLRVELPHGKPKSRLCNGISRRDALRIGATGLAAGLSLPMLLEMEARGAVADAPAKAVIFIFLEGGPSTIDMFDLKPEAPSEIRGPFRPIATKVPDIFVGEHCPKIAGVMDKFALVRSHTHEDNGHSTGYYYVMTGEKARFRDGQASRVPINPHFPSLGSKVARELGLAGSVPPYVNLPSPMEPGGPGFYGPQYAPFVIESDPVQADFEVKDLRPPGSISNPRMSRRQQLLAGVEQLQRKAEGKAAEMTTYYQKAHDLVTSPAAQKAFDLKAESEAVRARYGYSTIGQSALLARRLVEGGCRFIGIDHPGWDTHEACFPSLKDDFLPATDQAFSALLGDLEERGMLDSTMVVMMGEMGRTPRINKNNGRDHWSKAQSILIAGGGVKGGRVIGATDSQASEPTRDPMTIHDLHYLIYHQMGINPRKTYYTPLGRPLPLLNGGQLIPGMV